MFDSAICGVFIVFSLIALLFVVRYSLFFIGAFLFRYLLVNLSLVINELWISYSVKELGPLLAVNGLQGAEIEKLRNQFIREVTLSISPRYMKMLERYMTRDGVLLYIGKAFDRKVLPLITSSTVPQESANFTDKGMTE